MDVARVLAAILLLGNVKFRSSSSNNSSSEGATDSFDVEVVGDDELNAVASLLGVPCTLLCQGLISRTHSVRGQPVKSMSDANLVSARNTGRSLVISCAVVLQANFHQKIPYVDAGDDFALDIVLLVSYFSKLCCYNSDAGCMLITCVENVFLQNNFHIGQTFLSLKLFVFLSLEKIPSMAASLSNTCKRTIRIRTAL